MAHSSRRKGNRYERELVRTAEAAGLQAERAYASNGEALGESSSVDVTLGMTVPPMGWVRYSP